MDFEKVISLVNNKEVFEEVIEETSKDLLLVKMRERNRELKNQRNIALMILSFAVFCIALM